MSIELHVYAEERIQAARARVLEALRRRGWECSCVDERALSALPDGPIGYELILGMRIADSTSSSKGVLTSGDRKSIEDMYENGKLGSCAMSVDPEFDAGSNYGDLEEFSEEVGREVVDRLKRSKISYSLRTQAGRNDASYALQVALWESVGEVVDGLLYDEMSGEYLTLKAGEQVVLRAPPEDDSSPLAIFNTFFAEARIVGFPVDMNAKGEFTLRSERLSETDLDRLLEMIRQWFPEPLFAASFAEEMLEDFKKTKDEAYLKDRARWLADMENKHCRTEFD